MVQRFSRAVQLRQAKHCGPPLPVLNGVSSSTNLRTALIQRNVAENMSDIIVDSVLGDGLAR